jgi:crossover junction endodeoxyribonuclease RusA
VIRFVVPGNPVPWQRAGFGAGFRRGGKPAFFTKTETRQWEGIVRHFAVQAGATPLVGPVGLELRFFRATAHPCDLDNLEKAVKDGLKGVAYLDDRQVCDCTKRKRIDATRPRVEVEIWPLPGDVWPVGKKRKRKG